MRKINKYTAIIFTLIVLCALCTGCGKQTTEISKEGFYLNTIINITLYGCDDEGVLNNCFNICDEYEKKLSRTIETSEVAQLNALGSFTVSDDTLTLIKTGIEYAKKSDGAFDITIEPASSLWDFNSDDKIIPDQAALTEAVSHIDYNKIRIDGNTVTLEDGMGIDLGALAKGFIADKIKEYLLSANVKSAIINLGGNALIVGEKVNSEPFNVGIQDPEGKRNEATEYVKVKDLSVVTSGVYERHFELDGKNYHHILNPKTGMPYDNGLAGVTIISETSLMGDALSTTCFTLGIDKGLELIDSMDNVYAMFVKADGERVFSKGFEEYYHKM